MVLKCKQNSVHSRSCIFASTALHISSHLYNDSLFFNKDMEVGLKIKLFVLTTRVSYIKYIKRWLFSTMGVKFCQICFIQLGNITVLVHFPFWGNFPIVSCPIRDSINISFVISYWPIHKVVDPELFIRGRTDWPASVIPNIINHFFHKKGGDPLDPPMTYLDMYARTCSHYMDLYELFSWHQNCPNRVIIKSFVFRSIKIKKKISQMFT